MKAARPHFPGTVLAASAVAVLAVVLSSPVADASPYGINAHVPSRDQLARIRDAGIEWVRVDVVWSSVEPQQDRFDWSQLDRLVADAHDYGLKLFATLQQTPAWATDALPGSGPPRNPMDWYDFCYRAAFRYRGRVAAWGVWNEPNLERFWSGSRQAYIDDILRPASRAIRAADPTALVCGPDLAHLKSAHWADWLWDVLGEASDALDVVTHHVYPDGTASSVIDKLVAGGTLPWESQSVASILSKQGWKGRPFWLTETGYDSRSPDPQGEAEQALFVSGLLNALYGRNRQATWVQRVFFYELADGPGAIQTWGLISAPPESREKPALAQYRDLAGRLMVDDADLVSTSLPDRLAPGSSAVVSVTVRNSGSTTWSDQDGIVLAALPSTAALADPVQRLQSGQTVAPGQLATFTFSLTPAAGQAEGSILTAWQMQRQDAWSFGDQLRRTVTITSEAGGRTLWIPAAANSDGLNGTHWRTDLVLHNPTASPIVATVKALEPGRANDHARTAVLTVAPGTSTAVPGAVAALFGLSGSAALRIDSDRPGLLAMSRTFTGREGGSWGEFIPAVESPATPGTRLRLTGLDRSSDPARGVRTNVGLLNTDDRSCEVDVHLYDRGGLLLGTLADHLPPFGFTQLTDVFGRLTSGAVTEGVVEVEPTPEGHVLAFASSVDNRTGDPTYVAPVPATDVPLIVPVASHTTGVGSSKWVTSLDLLNPGTDPVSVTVRLIGVPGSSGDPIRVVPGGEADRLDDLIATFFGLSGTYAIGVVGAGGPIAVTSRTANVGAAGTFGQAVPVVAEGDAIVAGETGRLLELAQSPDPGRGFRTNLGFVNLDAHPLDLQVELYRSPGTRLGVLYLTLPNRGVRMVTEAFRRFTSQPVEDGFALVTSATPGARYVAWASLIDNLTGDPSFQLAQRPR